MRIFLCNSRDKERDYYVNMAYECGNTIVEEDGAIFVEVLRDGRVHHSPDAIQQPMASGTYTFDEKGRVVRVQ